MDSAIIKKIFNHMKRKEISKYYLGIFSIKNFNELDIRSLGQFSLILFIDNISKHLGHWVTVVKASGKLIFLDSYGHKPAFYKKKIRNRYSSFNRYLKSRLQSDFSTTCGAYCVFLIDLISHSRYDISRFTETFLNIFKGKNLIVNDKYIVRYIFNVYPRIKNKRCVSLFCNAKFITNFKKCIMNVCS